MTTRNRQEQHTFFHHHGRLHRQIHVFGEDGTPQLTRVEEVGLIEEHTFFHHHGQLHRQVHVFGEDGTPRPELTRVEEVTEFGGC